MTELAKKFQYELNNIFGEKRVSASIIHDDRDICINSNEREILYAIQEQQHVKHNHYWSFSESFFTKALIISITYSPKPQFDGLSQIYKNHFKERISKIIDKYDGIIPKNDNYVKVKKLYNSAMSKEEVNFEEYKKLRVIFENLRIFEES